MNVAWEIDGFPAILDLVHRGHGYAVLPLNAVRGDPLRRPFVPRPIVRPKPPPGRDPVIGIHSGSA